MAICDGDRFVVSCSGSLVASSGRDDGCRRGGDNVIGERKAYAGSAKNIIYAQMNELKALAMIVGMLLWIGVVQVCG